MFKRRLLAIALALAAVMSIQSVRAADEYTESEPVERAHLSLADGCIDVWATTSQVDAVRYGDAIPVRLVWVLKPTAICQKKQPEVKLLPPSAAPAPAASATPASPGQAPDIAKVLLPIPLEVPELNLQTIISGQLTNSPSDVEKLKVGKTGELLLDPACGPKCGKMVVQDVVVTQHITMQTIPPSPGATPSTPKPDDKTPPKYKTQATIIMDFDYAIFKQPGDNQPAWRTEHTPALVVGIHQSARISAIDPRASETLLREGDRSEKVSPLPPAARWVGALALALALPMFVWLVLTLIWLIRRERVLGVNEKVWLVIDEAVKVGEEAESNGEHFPIEQYRRIFFVLRKHFDVLGRDTTQTLKTLSERKELDATAVGHVFNRETLFFDGSRTVPPEDRAEFLRNIEVLIPRR
ncbi:MAG: hypothetical protein P4L53_06480 [Candidatus Obscuribacterales bacterium]|nr:hypothetical protein [Candidatus Obscuribacterales bacterium]